MMPAYTALAVLFGLGIHRAFAMSASLPQCHVWKMQMLLYILCFVQFGILIYKPLDQMPGRDDITAGEHFLSTLREIDGEVLVPYHGYLPVLADKQSHAQWSAVYDVLRGKGPVSDKLRNEIQQTIRDKRFAAIVLDSRNWFGDTLNKHYRLQTRIFETRNRFWPVTGLGTRPVFLYVPRSDVDTGNDTCSTQGLTNTGTTFTNPQ
jgi:hypothetical protein